MAVKGSEELYLEKSDILNEEIIDSNKFDYKKLFKYGCEMGKLGCVKFLYEKYNVDVHENNEEVFRVSCMNGHLEVAKWLYGLDGKINIHYNNEEAFIDGCYSGDLEVVKWLYGLDGKIDIHANREHAFYWSCMYGHLEMAKWLYGLDGKIDIHGNNEKMFQMVCGNGNVEILKYLMFLNKKIGVKEINKAISNGINDYMDSNDYRESCGNKNVVIKMMKILMKYLLIG